MNMYENKLSTLIMEDTQPIRAMYKYLSESMFLLEGYECVMDYYNGNKIKMNNELFLNLLSNTVVLMKEDYLQEYNIEDLTLNFSKECKEDELYVYSYYLSMGINEDWQFLFKIKNNTEEYVVGSIEVSYMFEFENYDFSELEGNYRKIEDEFLNVIVSGTDGEHQIDFKDVEFFKPISKVLF